MFYYLGPGLFKGASKHPNSTQQNEVDVFARLAVLFSRNNSVINEREKIKFL